MIASYKLSIHFRQLDDGIAEAVISILWAAPRVATDISEFKVTYIVSFVFLFFFYLDISFLVPGV